MAKKFNTSNYSWKITGKKVLIIAGEVVVAGLVVYFTDNNIYLGLVPILEGLRNYLKHRKD